MSYAGFLFLLQKLELLKDSSTCGLCIIETRESFSNNEVNGDKNVN